MYSAWNDSILGVMSAQEARTVWRASLKCSVEDLNDALSAINDRILYDAERGYTDIFVKDYKTLIPDRQVRRYVELALREQNYIVIREDEGLIIDWSIKPE